MSTQRQSRIPTSLQAVFLTSNRGMEVSQPPPERVAFKVFFRNWRFQSKTLSDSGNKGGVGAGIVNSFRKNKGSLSSNSCSSPSKSKKQDLFHTPTKCDAPASPEPKVKYQPLLKPKEPVAVRSFFRSLASPNLAALLRLTQHYHLAILRSTACDAHLVPASVLGCLDPIPWVQHLTIQEFANCLLQQTHPPSTSELRHSPQRSGKESRD